MALIDERDRLHLGELEVAVLDELWRAGPATVKQIHASLEGVRGAPLNSVQACLERLFRKRLLDRQKVSHAYVYSACADRRSVLEVAVGEVLDRLAGQCHEPALSAFVDLAAREGEETLRRLEELVAKRLQAGEEEE